MALGECYQFANERIDYWFKIILTTNVERYMCSEQKRSYDFNIRLIEEQEDISHWNIFLVNFSCQ